jgi:hypothetical protein
MKVPNVAHRSMGSKIFAAKGVDFPCPKEMFICPRHSEPGSVGVPLPWFSIEKLEVRRSIALITDYGDVLCDT